MKVPLPLCILLAVVVWHPGSVAGGIAEKAHELVAMVRTCSGDQVSPPAHTYFLFHVIRHFHFFHDQREPFLTRRPYAFGILYFSQLHEGWSIV